MKRQLLLATGAASFVLALPATASECRATRSPIGGYSVLCDNGDWGSGQVDALGHFHGTLNSSDTGREAGPYDVEGGGLGLGGSTDLHRTSPHIGEVGDDDE